MRLAIIALLLAGTAAPALAQFDSVSTRVDKFQKEMAAAGMLVGPVGRTH